MAHPGSNQSAYKPSHTRAHLMQCPTPDPAPTRAHAILVLSIFTRGFCFSLDSPDISSAVVCCVEEQEACHRWCALIEQIAQGIAEHRENVDCDGVPGTVGGVEMDKAYDIKTPDGIGCRARGFWAQVSGFRVRADGVLESAQGAISSGTSGNSDPSSACASATSPPRTSKRTIIILTRPPTPLGVQVTRMNDMLPR